MTELKPKRNQELRKCPFCGGKAKTYTAYGGYAHQIIWLVHCNRCHLNYPSKQQCDTELQAIEAWNRRDGDTDENTTT